MNEFGLIEPDVIDVMVEVAGIQEEISTLDDHTLVDEVVHLVEMFDFSKETERILGEYFSSGTLDVNGRKILEGCYINAYGVLSINEKGQICITQPDNDEDIE